MDITDARKTKLSLSMKIASSLVLLFGLGLALLTLSSAAGIWLGFWDFRRGFALLRPANEWGDVILWACVGITVTVAIANQLVKPANGSKLIIMAASGTVVAAIAFYIPESFRPGEGVNYPPIHDISTNLISPPEFVAILPLRVDAANTVIYGGSNNMTPERLVQLTEEAYPDLVTLRYSESADEVFSKALAAVDELGWELVDQSTDEGRIEATDTTFWFRFKDDIVIEINQQGSETLVDARSVSRVGTGDVGANAIRLRKLFELL